MTLLPGADDAGFYDAMDAADADDYNAGGRGPSTRPLFSST
jgi:hypothetical protein